VCHDSPKENTMKNTSIALLLVLIFTIGCQDQKELVEDTNQLYRYPALGWSIKIPDNCKHLSAREYKTTIHMGEQDSEQLLCFRVSPTAHFESEVSNLNYIDNEELIERIKTKTKEMYDTLGYTLKQTSYQPVINGLEFYGLKTDILRKGKRVYTDERLFRYFDSINLGISFKYFEAEDGKILKDVFFSSTFSR